MSANNSPTVFTDEDLANLEKVCASMDGKFESWNFVEKDGASIKALLERLKWAEKCAELCATDENCCNIPELGENDISPYYLWRRAAGKPV